MGFADLEATAAAPQRGKPPRRCAKRSFARQLPGLGGKTQSAYASQWAAQSGGDLCDALELDAEGLEGALLKAGAVAAAAASVAHSLGPEYAFAALADIRAVPGWAELVIHDASALRLNLARFRNPEDCQEAVRAAILAEWLQWASGSMRNGGRAAHAWT